MDITKIGLIGLTLASFVLVPSMPSLDADSTELASWHSEVYENLNGIHQNYDFQKYSPDLNAMVDNIVQTYNGALSSVITFYELLENFFTNPGVVIFGEEEFSDDALDIGSIPDGRFTQILFASTFLSNQQVVEQVLSDSEIAFITTKPLFQDWNWIQGYFIHFRNILWPISDLSIYDYCLLVD
jgi:hypothetical protein